MDCRVKPRNDSREFVPTHGLISINAGVPAAAILAAIKTPQGSLS